LREDIDTNLIDGVRNENFGHNDLKMYQCL